MILTMQVIGLYFGVWFAIVTVSRLMSHENVPAINFMIMSAAWTLFIAATWLI